MGADLLRFSRRAVDANRDIGAPRREADAIGFEADFDPLGFERFADRLGDILILAGNQARHFFHDRHCGAEAPEYLRELEPDVASSDDDEALGQGVEFEQRRVCQRRT